MNARGRSPRLVSLVPSRFEDGGFSGVPRFDWELRRALPELVSVNQGFRNRAWLRWLALRAPDTIVITGNETSLLVPDRLRTIVMHHGCAQTHFDRDPEWRGREPRAFCSAQRAMYSRPNRWYVAAAAWTAEQFSLHHGVPLAPVLPNWVEPMARKNPPRARPLVIGDFRTFNKGQATVERLVAAAPEFEFRNLACTYDTRGEVYGAADAYLGLSLSEGGSYALSDAEATSLPLVMTDVGNHAEYKEARVIGWQVRDDVDAVRRALEDALERRRGPSFFEEWSLARWQRAWRELVERVADEKARAPLLA